jgi:5-methylcytosine-specific restriction protein B
MPDNLHKTLQPYIIRFKNGFAEHEKNNSINGKNGLEVREYLKAKVQNYFSEEQIDHLTRDDFIDLYNYSPALLSYALGSRGHLHEEVERFIDTVGTDEFRKKIKSLLHGNGNVAERYAEVITSTKSVNHAVTSEILSYYSPSEYACLNGTAEKALIFLGLATPEAPRTGKQCGEYYLQFNAIARELLNEIRKEDEPVLRNADFTTLDYFLNMVGWINMWQIAPGEGAKFWVVDPIWKEKKIAAVGFHEIVDRIGEKITGLHDYQEILDEMKNTYPDWSSQKLKINARMAYNFINDINYGDIIFANKGKEKILSIGRVVSEAKVDPSLEYPIYRDVDWFHPEADVKIPEEMKGIFGKTITSMKHKDALPLLKSAKKSKPAADSELFQQDADIMDDPAFRKMNRLLTAKNQIILYGPPGTGKTHAAQRYIAVHNARASAFVTFHPSFAYEDFIEGLRPQTDDEGRISYGIEDGIFKSFCMKAFNALMEAAGLERRWEEGHDVPALSEAEKAQALDALDRVPFYLVIDEINRGDIPRIFGELITLLEKDKRLCTDHELATTLPYSKTRFGIPPNLFIIGTMNTADRSIALLDIALRRRFGFIEMMPDYGVLEEHLGHDDPSVQEIHDLAIAALRQVNTRVAEQYDRDHQIGHSYLMKLGGSNSRDEAVETLQYIWYYEVLPLMQEYFYDAPQKLKDCVGSGFVILGEKGRSFTLAEERDGEEFIQMIRMLVGAAIPQDEYEA